MEVLNQGNCPRMFWFLDLILHRIWMVGVLEGLNNLELSKYPRVVVISAVGRIL